MPNLSDALNMKAGDVERPPLIPQGTYRMRVEKIPALGKTSKEDYETVGFMLRGLEARDDVDTDDLAKFGGIKNVITNHQFFFPTGNSSEEKANFDRATYNLKKFLTVDLKAGDENASLSQLLNDSVHKECVVSIGWKPDKENPELMWARITKTAPVE